METRNKQNVTGPEEPVDLNQYASRKLSAAENAVLTAKVLGTIGIIGAIVWGVTALTSPN
jgi:hypothetical protein